jgi:serine/threonine-protein kinase RsbW
MKANATDTAGERLALRSSLSDLARVSPWIEYLAAQYAISDNTQFAMNLCLEEVLSNVIRHGYAGQPGRPILVQFASSPRDGYFTFVVEDEAPLFDPLTVPEPPVPRSLDETHVGGNGICLLRHFADKLEYHSTPTGNRLTLAFRAADSATAVD